MNMIRANDVFVIKKSYPALALLRRGTSVESADRYVDMSNLLPIILRGEFMYPVYATAVPYTSNLIATAWRPE